ncbi:Polyketide cyclase/dehydrase and lipid transport superfamily protein [Rhynchospora pubera]|uniref:Polyketide cyclase/dehydrase and lipid transport superfamily protein n=1 Tax=Rhynchospora pubera TaxID=906938 RepID=A0AAV8EPC9_9POAL|nr:Polyketide cyclase/dehydrase and lipid transport superfamily protein [Rhynchospora pubera]KAJ4804621.1 Polyketide cyclase/dehydrase and lipid transport superfamily protein [Rhynchospora pubera]
MAWVLNSIMEILNRPNTWRIVSDLLLFVSPIWLAVFIGLLVGWTWKPDWAVEFLNRNGGGSEKKVLVLGPETLPTWRFLPKCDFWKQREEKTESRLEEDKNDRKLAVTGADFLHLYRLVEETDEGPTWQHMMDRSLPNMSYQAWRREPENSPTQYRSSTIFENATPEQVRDFFWDDEFRISNKWDDMLIHYQILEECRTTGTMIVHWVRKFPFFCSDREYIIGRRIWNLEGTYYCVTKAVPCSAIQRRNKPRRVDVYFSSWCIRAVESRRSGGQKTACEVMLFHYEDMGIPKEIAKLGIRQGMWGCVKRIEPGLRAYQLACLPSRPDPLSQINTKIKQDYITTFENARYLEEDVMTEGSESEDGESKGKAGPVQKLPKILLIGGAMVLACSLDQGLLTKAVIFGVARRFVWPRKRV